MIFLTSKVITEKGIPMDMELITDKLLPTEYR